MAASRSPRVWLLALLPLGAALCFFVLPYVSALAAGFGGGLGETANTGTAYAVLKNPALLPVVGFTVRQAALSTLTALALGLPGAWLLAILSGKGGRASRRLYALVRSLTSIPFAMPPILVVLAFVLFFGNSGWANRFFMAVTGSDEGPIRILYKPSAIILAHGFYNFPLVIRLVGDGIAASRKAYAPAAASLGASPLASAVTVLFPLAFPSLMAACLLVFLYSFTSFAVVLVLGGGPAATTLAVEIYRYARLSLDFRSAGSLAIIETLIALAAFAAYIFFDRKSRAASVGDIRDLETRNGSPIGKIAIILYALVLIVFVMGPLLSIPVESLLWRPSRAAPVRLSSRYWLTLGEQALPALGRSLILAALSATLATFLALLAAAAVRIAGAASVVGTLIRVSAAAPLASSGIVLGLGWLALYGREHSRSLLAVVILHGVTALPFAFNSISAGLRAIPANTANAASVFGAGPLLRILTVEAPLSFPRIRSAWAFSAAISLGELNALLMLGMEHFETLPLLIYRAAGSYRYGAACAAGTLLILCCAGAFLLSELGSSHGD
jgi:thiamine transport system permease protein